MMTKYLTSAPNIILSTSLIGRCGPFTSCLRRQIYKTVLRNHSLGLLTTFNSSHTICKPLPKIASDGIQSHMNANELFNIQKRYILSIQKKPQEGLYKIHLELENSELYKVLLGLPELNDTLAPILEIKPEHVISDKEFETIIVTDHSELDRSQILQNFKKLTFYMADKEDNLSHSPCDNICNALIQSLQYMSDEDICKVLFLLQVWSQKCFRKDRNYAGIYIEIDRILLERLQRGNMYYSNDQLLLLLDFWAHVNLLRASNFCKVALRKLLNRSHHLAPKKFVQLMFYHCRYRVFHPLASAYEIEFTFDKKYSLFSPTEIAVVLLAFFKSQKRFQNKNLCVKIARTFISNVDKLGPIFANGYLKSMKHYFPIEHWDILYQVCNKLYQEIDSCHPFVLANTVSLGLKANVYHAKLIDKVVEKTLENLETVRIKDLQRVLDPVVIYNHELKQPHFIDALVNQFTSEHRQPEITKHPKCLVDFVQNLIVANHFNYTLIERCLDMDFLHEAFGKKLTGYVVPKDVLAIDMSVAIEAPDYKGPRLPESLKHVLCKHYAWRKPGELFQNRKIESDDFGLEVQSKLQHMLGEKYYQLAYVLPHCIKPDVIVCVKDGKAVPIPESMSDFVHMNAIPPPPVGKWYALIFVTFMQMVALPEMRMKGVVIMKIRQLEKLGYIPVIMKPVDWINATDEGREQLLKERLGLK